MTPSLQSTLRRALEQIESVCIRHPRTLQDAQASLNTAAVAARKAIREIEKQTNREPT